MPETEAAAPRTEKDDDFVKISANLPKDVVATLKEVAAARGITMTEVLRRGIGIEKFLLDAKRGNQKVLVEGTDRSLRELITP